MRLFLLLAYFLSSSAFAGGSISKDGSFEFSPGDPSLNTSLIMREQARNGEYGVFRWNQADNKFQASVDGGSTFSDVFTPPIPGYDLGENNFLSNGNFEDGTYTGWTATNPADLSIANYPAVINGNHSLSLSGNFGSTDTLDSDVVPKPNYYAIATVTNIRCRLRFRYRNYYDAVDHRFAVAIISSATGNPLNPPNEWWVLPLGPSSNSSHWLQFDREAPCPTTADTKIRFKTMNTAVNITQNIILDDIYYGYDDGTYSETNSVNILAPYGPDFRMKQSLFTHASTSGPTTANAKIRMLANSSCPSNGGTTGEQVCLYIKAGDPQAQIQTPKHIVGGDYYTVENSTFNRSGCVYRFIYKFPGALAGSGVIAGAASGSKLLSPVDNNTHEFKIHSNDCSNSKITLTSPSGTYGADFTADDFYVGPDLYDDESGTYTPSATNVVSTTINTIGDFRYFKSGRVVSIGGWIDATPTSTGALSSFNLSLPPTLQPIISGTNVDGWGTGMQGWDAASTSGNSWYCTWDTTNKIFKVFSSNLNNTNAQPIYFDCKYLYSPF